eukprot:2863336-Pyramimonas_sp.AAC.1
MLYSLAALLSQLARQQATYLRRQSAAQKTAGWEQWVKKHSVNDTAALFRYVRLPDPWQSSSIVQFVPANSMQEIQVLEAGWKKWWRVGAKDPPLKWPSDLGERPPAPTLEHLKRVLRTFPVGTGCGFDQLPSRQLLCLPDEALGIFCQLISCIEHKVEWSPMTTRMIFIFTKLGGVRPLALLHLSLSCSGAPQES